VRLARVVNVTRISDNLEELCIDCGLQWLIVVFTVVQIVASVFVVGHLFSCAWCGMGLHEEEFGHNASIGDQYLRAQTWVSGHLLSAPIDRTMTLRTEGEHLFALCLIWVKLFIMGAGISKITGAIAELGRANAQSKDTKRKLRLVMQQAGLGKDASSRMLHFALHAASRKRATIVEPAIFGLLSSTMANELIVSQRVRTLTLHPLFRHIKDKHPKIFSTLCGAFAPHVYADNEEVFAKGTLSERMYVTCSGTFIFDAGGASPDERATTIDGVTWLCEVSLFARTVHKGSLATRNFAESLTLTCIDLETCVRTSPACIGTIYHYARGLLPLVDKEHHDLLDMQMSHMALESALRSKVQDFHPVRFILFDEPLEFSRVIAAARSSKPATVPLLMEQVLSFFPEVAQGLGIYSSLNMEAERRRSTCALSSVMMLLCDRYDFFVQEQPERSRITTCQWAKLQDLMQWLDPSADMVHVALAFLSIRGLTKSASVLSAMGGSRLSVEDVLLSITEEADMVPSCTMLSDSQLDLLRQSIRLHVVFNFVQFLQGENSPSQVAAFQEMVAAEGHMACKVYLLQVVGMVCGIRGDEQPECPLFLGARNAEMLITGLDVFRHIETSSPQAIYWNFIAIRAQQLSLSTRSAEDFVFARLACLTRSHGPQLRQVEEAWKRLSHIEREALADLMLADGVAQQNLILKFLPAFFAGAVNNPHVGLHSSLVVLVDVLERLMASAFARTRSQKSLVVNVQSLAVFAEKARCASVFLAVPSYISFHEKTSEVAVVVATAHAQRASQRTWADQSAQEVALMVRRLRRQLTGSQVYRATHNALATSHAALAPSGSVGRQLGITLAADTLRL